MPFGSIRRLPSGNLQVRYPGPDGIRHPAPTTFTTKTDARAYLARTWAAIQAETWTPPTTEVDQPTQHPTLETYGRAWIAQRDLRTRTRELYLSLFTTHITPTFGHLELHAITPAAIRTWHAREAAPTARAHSYALLRTILATAVTDDLITANPCRIRSGGKARTVKRVRVASPTEVSALCAAMPDRYAAAPLLLFWCSLRFGELAGLQRADVDLPAAVLRIRRGVVRTRAGLEVSPPKTDAGTRDVTIPAHILPTLTGHLEQHTAPGAAAWVFPGGTGGPLAASTFRGVFTTAAATIGRPDLSPHALRHSGQTLAAGTGASLAELMARAGQVSPGAALRYLHDSSMRQREIAARLSEMAEGT